jgi:hypothetical protein
MHNKNTQRNRIIFTLPWLFLSTLSFAGAKPAPALPKPNPTQWEEIYSWKSLGSRWEAGIDKTGQTLAIYDLSINEMKNRVFLGVLDPSLDGINDLISAFKEKQKEMNSFFALDNTDSNLRLEVKKAIQTLNEIKIQYFQNFSSLDHNEDRKEIFPKNWWKQIPWKTSIRTLSEDPPKKFSLSDIDFQRLAKNPEEFKNKLNEIGPHLLEQLQFVSSGTGVYSIYWQPSQTQSVESTRPQKIVDLRCVECGYINTMMRSAAIQALTTVIGQIPVPALAGLLGAAVSEYIYFNFETTRLHEEMALEMIQEADESTLSPFSPLTSEERARAAQYLVLAQVGLLQSLQFIGSNSLPSWAEEKWTKQKQEALDFANSSQKELASRGEKYALLNSRFAHTSEEGLNQKNIYVLAHPKQRQTDSPHLAIDFKNRTKIQEERIGLETGRALLNFLTFYIPVPVVGTLINTAYNWAVIGPMHHSQYWEARLASHLEDRQFNNESWQEELQMIDRQRVNPFELESAKALEKVRLKRLLLHTPIGSLL